MRDALQILNSLAACRVLHLQEDMSYAMLCKIPSKERVVPGADAKGLCPMDLNLKECKSFGMCIMLVLRISSRIPYRPSLVSEVSIR